MSNSIRNSRLEESINTYEKDHDTYRIYVTEHISTLISYWDKHQICRYANQAYYTWFGIDPLTIINPLTINILLGSSYKQSITMVKNVLKGIPQSYHQNYRSPDGHVTPCFVTLTPHTIDNVVEGFIAQIVQLEYDKRITDGEAVINVIYTDKVMEQVAEYLRQQIFKDFPGLEELAKAHFISVAKLKRDFKKYFNTSPFAYYRNLQMQFVDSQLQENNFNKKELAAMLNFSNPANFYSCYKKYKQSI